MSTASAAASSTSAPASLFASHPLALLRSGLLVDMPRSPSSGLHAALPSPASASASASSQPLALPDSSSSPHASPDSPPSPAASSRPPSSAEPAAPRPALRVVLRWWLLCRVPPLFRHKATRLLVSLIAATFELIVLYFAAFAFYLTHLLAPSSASASACSSFALSLFLVFLLFRSLCALLLVGIRMRDSAMWVNQRAQMSRANKVFHLLSLALLLLSAAFVALGYAWLASNSSSQCVQLAKPLVAAIVAYETLAVLWPLCAIALLASMFPLRALSPFTPYLPLTSATFVQDRRGLSRRDVESLPSFVCTAGLLAADDRRCAICLCDVELGERVRQLRCSHRFHQPCVDQWLRTKPTCPLCVRTVDAESKQRRFRFSLSRTRQHSSASSAGSRRPAQEELSTTAHARGTESSRRADEHENGVGPHDADNALEMV